ncbi:unnamed protein product, partial [Closterium sp. NIES-53]
TLLTARILDCLPPTYDTYRINFTSQHIRPPPVAVTIDWLLDSEADLLRDSTTVNAVHARKGTNNTGGSSSSGPGRGSSGGGRGGGRGGRTWERGGRGATTPSTGGFPPCQYVIRQGPNKGQTCNQTTHPTETCFKALTDEWLARGNTGPPPRWNTITPRPTPHDIRTLSTYAPSPPNLHNVLAQHLSPHVLQQVQHLLPTPTTTPTPSTLTTPPPPTPPPPTPPSPYPPLYPPPYAGWPYPPYPPSMYGHRTAATAATAEQPTSSSHPPGFTPFPSTGFIGHVTTASSCNNPMYANAINESSFQYSVSSSSQSLEFILDSGATHTVLRHAGTLLPLSTPSTIYGADSSFAIQSRYTSTLPCPLFPSGSVTGLYVPSLRNNL